MVRDFLHGIVLQPHLENLATDWIAKQVPWAGAIVPGGKGIIDDFLTFIKGLVRP